MRIQIFLAVIFLRNAFSRPLVQSIVQLQLRRDFKLTGLLDSDKDDFISSYSTQTALKPFRNSQTTSLSIDGLGGLATSEAKTKGPTTTAASMHTNSIISTPEMRDTTTAQITITSSSTGTSTSTVSPTVSVGFTKEAPKTPPDEATEWKVIGVAVIAIGFVATAILAIAFFDSWWGFLRATVMGKRKGGGVEDMVPDWEKRTWEFKLANEDGHRYPTLSSLESITKEQYVNAPENNAGNPLSACSSPHQQYFSPTLPKATYLAECDPHPLEPLVRRPSTKLPMNTFSGGLHQC